MIKRWSHFTELKLVRLDGKVSYVKNSEMAGLKIIKDEHFIKGMADQHHLLKVPASTIMEGTFKNGETALFRHIELEAFFSSDNIDQFDKLRRIYDKTTKKRIRKKVRKKLRELTYNEANELS